MGFFKKKVVKEIHDAAWGCLTNEHRIDVDTLAREVRCVERDGVVDGNKVTLMRVFNQKKQAEKTGVTVTEWETFDQHPELVLFEGFLTRANKAFLQKRGGYNKIALMKRSRHTAKIYTSCIGRRKEAVSSYSYL